MKKFLLGLLLGLLIVGVFGYFRLLFPPIKDPPLPQLLTIHATPVLVKDNDYINQPTIFGVSCDQDDVFQLIALSGEIHSKNIEKNFLYKDGQVCNEYVISDDQSIVDYHYYSIDGLLALKTIFKGNVYFSPILANMIGYPGWKFNLLQVNQDGKIYVDYGGWNFFGKNHSGTATFQITLSNIALDKSN